MTDQQKRYNDLSRMERARLTREQLESYLTIEYMVEGLTRPKELQLQELPAYPKMTDPTTMFQLNVGGSNSGVYRTIEQATNALKLQPVALNYEYMDGYKYYLAEDQDIRINTVLVYPEAAIKLLQDVSKTRNEISKANKALTTAYEDTREVLNSISDPIVSDWQNCQAEFYQRQQALANWKDFLGLSNDDSEIAYNFFQSYLNRLGVTDEWMVETFETFEVEVPQIFNR